MWALSVSTMYFDSQNMVFATVNVFHAANQIFDNILNALHSMDFATEKDDNESYTLSKCSSSRIELILLKSC